MKNQHSQSVPSRSKWAAIVLTCAILMAATGLWLRYRLPEKLPPPREEKSEGRPLLATVAASRSVRQGLLTKDFVLVDRFRDLSSGCRTGFLSSFTTADSGKLSSADVADPGEPFQFSDALVAGLPFRRLILAGDQPGKCFLYYQHGGKMYAEYCLAIIDEITKKPVWVGIRNGGRPVKSIDELRAQLTGDAFRDDLGLVC